MKLTLPMLWSALIVFAALVLLPWLMLPSVPDQSQVLESIRGRLERMTHLLETQNRLLAESRIAEPNQSDLAQPNSVNPQRMPVGSSDALAAETESELRLLIQEMRSAVSSMAHSGTKTAAWQPNAVRASLHSSRERNQRRLESLIARLEGDDEGLWDEFYFRTMPEILNDLGRPDSMWPNKGVFYFHYNDVPVTIDGELEQMDLDLRFQDGICIYADIN